MGILKKNQANNNAKSRDESRGRNSKQKPVAVGKKPVAKRRLKNNETSWKNRIKQYFLWGFSLMVFCLVASIFIDTIPAIKRQFLIQSVAITGVLENTERVEIERAIEPLVKSGYFTADLESIKLVLESLSWIKSVDVRRVWPNALLVHINEKQAIAQWQKKELISAEGKNFQPEKIKSKSKLPLLSGPDDKAGFVMSNYHQMSRVLRAAGLNIKSLHLEDRYSWKLVLDNKIIVRVDAKKSLEKLQGMVSLLKKVPADDLLKIESIDLRYENGLALRQSMSGLAG